MSTHPFDGEGFDRSRAIRFWDDIAYDYEGRIMQGDMPVRIAERLAERGIIGKETDIIELGCGPGTYTVPLSQRVRSVTCLDTSEKMISILKGSCASNNVFPVVGDFMEYVPDRRFDAAIMTLCPGTGTPEGIRKVESLTDGWCVHIMWTENCWDEIHAKVWKELGREYSFDARKAGLMESNLRSLGRSYDVEEFTADVEWTMPASELIEREKRVFSAYGPIEAEDALRAVLDGFIDGDRFSFGCTNSIKMICWRP